MRTFTATAFVAFASIGSIACDDTRKVSEQAAADQIARLVPLVKEDALQVRRGLPEGAKKLGGLLEPDPGNNLASLQRTIAAARASVKDLDVAKSTFFSFADPQGVVLRSEADPDMLAGKSIFAAFPALKKAADPKSGVVEAYGPMQELRGVRNGPDTAWIVAHPVKNAEGAAVGLFVTGWSFRRFAFHLQEMAKRDLTEAAEKEKKKSVPITYVFAVKGGSAYGAPLTPDVDAQAIEGLNLLEKTKNGPFRGSVVVTGRTFGVAAQRTPELGDDAAIAIMISQI
jgi:hypothetical protein